MTPLRVIRNREPQTIVFPADTVVIDRFLLQVRNSARRRFTLAHEAAHIILNRSYNGVPSRYNRVFDPEQSYTVDELSYSEHGRITNGQSGSGAADAAGKCTEYLR